MYLRLRRRCSPLPAPEQLVHTLQDRDVHAVAAVELGVADVNVGYAVAKAAPDTAFCLQLQSISPGLPQLLEG